MADTLDPKGMVCVPCCLHISEGVSHLPLGVEKAATDRENTFTRNWGTLITPCPATGCENASTGDRGRQRNSLTLSRNGGDLVKVCQGKTLDERNKGCA